MLMLLSLHLAGFVMAPFQTSAFCKASVQWLCSVVPAVMSRYQHDACQPHLHFRQCWTAVKPLSQTMLHSLEPFHNLLSHTVLP